jgi:two-component system nitrate/nitrite response regulator NarL
MAEIRVVVIDDHPLFRAGVTHTLRRDSSIEVVGEGCSASDAVEQAQQHRPDVMVLDMNMPGGGITALRGVLACSPQVKPLMLTGIVDDEQVSFAMQQGAWGYVLKGVSGTELIRTLRVIHGGERYVSPALAARLFAAVPAAPAKAAPDVFASLTAREEQVLALIVEGLSNKEIGGRLLLSEKTVKHYLTIVLDKLHVRTRVQAALLAYSKFGRVSGAAHTPSYAAGAARSPSYARA